MSGFLDALRGVLGDGWGENVQREGVRPDYGLSTATGVSPLAKSGYERTLRPGEERTTDDLQSMLAEVFFAAGGVPGMGAAKTRPARTIPRHVETPMGAGVTRRVGGRVTVENPTTGARMYDLSRGEYRAMRRGGALKRGETGTEIDVYHGTTSSGLRPEPGLHVGTPEQANFRAMLARDPVTNQAPAGAKVFPLKMRPRKMVEIDDLGNAMSFPGNKAEELVRVGAFSKAEGDAVLRAANATKAINDLLLQKRIDALRYGNQWEGEGRSYEVINPSILFGRFSGEVFKR